MEQLPHTDILVWPSAENALHVPIAHLLQSVEAVSPKAELHVPLGHPAPILLPAAHQAPAGQIRQAEMLFVDMLGLNVPTGQSVGITVPLAQ